MGDRVPKPILTLSMADIVINEKQASILALPHPVAAAARWPLVGRGNELTRIADAREAAEAGVVIVGRAGVGKSRLAREAVAAAAAEGALASWVQATRSAASVPLGACAQLLPPEIRSDSDDRAALYLSTADALRERAGGRAIVIGVDDAQHLDRASSALVLHLMRTGTAFVVATVRSSDSYPDAAETLWKEAGAELLELGAHSEAETDELIEKVLHGPVEERAREWAFRSTMGNVLYLHELVSGAIAQGAFEQRAGIWRLAETPKPSSSLIGLIETRLADLSPDQRGVIELLALGEPLRVQELVGLVGAGAVATVEGLALVLALGEDEDPELVLGHPLYGEVIRASMPSLRAATARRELSETFEKRPNRSPDDELRMARWLLDAGETPSLPLLISAADAALAAGDPEFARRLGRLAVDAGAGIAASLRVARACTRLMEYEEAESILAPLEGTLTDRETANAYLQQRIVCLLWGLDREADALALLDRARGWWEDPAWFHQLASLRPRLVTRGADYRAAAAESEKLLEPEDLDPSVRRRTEIVHLGNLLYSGRIREAWAKSIDARPSVPLRDESDESTLLMACVLSGESGLAGEEDEAWMRSVFIDGIKARDGAAAGLSAVCLGGLHLLQGRYADARRSLGEAVVRLEDRDPFGGLKIAHALSAGVAFYLDEPNEASAAMERCRTSIQRALLDADRPYVVRGEAWLAQAEGDPPRAQAGLVEAAAQLHHVPLYAIQLYHEAMRAGLAPRKVLDPLEELRHVCDGRLPVACIEDAVARAAGDAAAVLVCSEEFADLGAARHASECAALAAELFAEEGRQDSARRAAVRSAELQGRCQGGEAPAIRLLTPDRADLTPREAQLADLARRGLGNGEIAERLGVSVRTVESHIYRAMQKLDIANRHEL